MKIRIFLLFVLFSCNTTIKNDSLDTFFNEYYLESYRSYKAIIFIPFDGCSKCIKQGVEFVSDNLQNKDICFVLSHYSQKKITMELDEYNLKKSNIIVDTALIAYKTGLIESEPVIYYINSEKVIKQIKVTSEIADNEYKELIEFINSKSNRTN